MEDNKQINDKLLEQIHQFSVMQHQNYKLTEDLNYIIHKQSILLESMAQIINMQSQSLNSLNNNMQIITLKMADMEIKNQITDDYIRDFEQGLQQISQDIQDLKVSVDNIKIFKMIPDNY